MRSVVVWVVLIGACVKTSSVPCGDGVCAPGTVCNEEHGQCLTPDQLVSCVGKADGELCPVGAETGICDGELCLAVICGDGVVQGIEQCDGAPPETTCFDLGYDAGFLGCSDAVCAANLGACRRVGWRAVTAPASGAIRVMTSAEGVGYAARGTAAILRFRNGAWAPIASPSPGAIVYSLYAAAADDLWAGTEDGVFHFDGTTWTLQLGLESLFRAIVVGTGPDDVYAFVSANGNLAFHFDGTQWVSITSPPSFVTTATAGAAGTFIGSAAELYRLSSGAWQSVAHPLTSIDTMTSYGSQLVIAGPTDPAHAEILIGDGVTWSRHDVTREIGWKGGGIRVGGRTANDLYAVEIDRPYVVRFDGTRWLRDAELPANGLALQPVGAQMFAGTLDGLARESPDAFTDVADILGTVDVLAGARALSGRSCDDVFVAVAGASTEQSSQIHHFDGTRWSLELDAPMTTITDIEAGGNGEAYATTYMGRLWRRASGGWTLATEEFPSPLEDLSIAPDGTIVMAGGSWVHVFFDGAWHSEQLSTPIASVLALSRDEVYALGYRSVFRLMGSSWVEEPLPMPDLALSIWGQPGGNLVVVGRGGRAWHRDQGVWSLAELPFEDFVAVHGAIRADVFALGANGTIAHFDGTHWAPLRDRLPHGGRVWNGGACTYFVGGIAPSSVGRLRRTTTW